MHLVIIMRNLYRCYKTDVLLAYLQLYLLNFNLIKIYFFIFKY